MSFKELRPVIGISSCLMGKDVRYDGDNKLDPELMHAWGPHVEWVGVCPEAEVGMGVPREPVGLRAASSSTLESAVLGPLMIGNTSGEDWTDRMNTYAARRAEELAGRELWGYVVKARSPSCGPLVDVQGGPKAAGLFTAALAKRLPFLPIADEEELANPERRDAFIRRVFAYQRLRWFFSKDRSVGQLVMFHSQSRLELNVHSRKAFKELSELIDNSRDMPWDELSASYQEGFTHAMLAKPTRAKHQSALQHVATKLDLTTEQKEDLDTAIGDYANARVPLLQPLAIAIHYVATQQTPSLDGQSYLDPHPAMLSMLNHA
ncbi:MAG: YbgA family protein [Actinomycetota bacterium]|nr:DUF523 and DUF1722 domain-containing protein [Actinomycetota bacterium]